MKLTWVILLIIFSGFVNGYGQDKQAEETTERIKDYLAKLESIGFNGAVLVELNGRKVISDAYGFSDRKKKISNSPSTIFDICSITKQFTAAAILKLEMQGKLSTEDKLSKYFEDLPEDKKDITIHELLRHRSGLQSNVGTDYEKISKQELIDKVFNSALRAQPGTRFSYSNIGYSLLAMIIEKVSERSYESYIYENLWKPAKMEYTGYTRPKFDQKNIAIGYHRNENPWGRPTDKEWDTDAPFWHLLGNGGVLSTTEDLYKWHQAFTTETILSEDAKMKLYHPKLEADEDENSIYAYGWDVSKTSRNTLRVWHNGTNRIFYADFLRYIDESTTVIMLSNRSHPHFDGLTTEISRMIFSKDYQPEIPFPDNEANRNFTKQLIETLQKSGYDRAKRLYKQRKKGLELLEFEMRNKGFDLIDDNKPELAIQIFEMNVFAFPASAKALQGLGEGYMETGNRELALRYLKRSLALQSDNPFVNDLIKELQR